MSAFSDQHSAISQVPQDHQGRVPQFKLTADR